MARRLSRLDATPRRAEYNAAKSGERRVEKGRRPDPTNYFSRRDPPWRGETEKRARSFDFIPVCSMESAFFCLQLVDLPFDVTRRPRHLGGLRQRSPFDESRQAFPSFSRTSFPTILSSSATCSRRLLTFKLVILYLMLRIFVRNKNY